MFLSSIWDTQVNKYRPLLQHSTVWQIPGPSEAGHIKSKENSLQVLALWVCTHSLLPLPGASPKPLVLPGRMTTPWRPLLDVSTLSLWLWSPARMSSFFHCQGSPRSQAAAVHSLSCYEGSMWVPVVRVPYPAFRTLSALCLQHSYCTRVLPSGASQSYRLDRWQAIAELAGISQNCKNYAN